MAQGRNQPPFQRQDARLEVAEVLQYAGHPQKLIPIVVLEMFTELHSLPQLIPEMLRARESLLSMRPFRTAMTGRSGECLDHRLHLAPVLLQQLIPRRGRRSLVPFLPRQCHAEPLLLGHDERFLLFIGDEIVEIAAGGHGPLYLLQPTQQLLPFNLQRPDALAILELAEAAFNGLADGLGVRQTLYEQGCRAISNAESALDWFGLALDQPQRLLQDFAALNRHEAHTLRVDPPPSGPSCHLREFPDQQRSEAILAALAEVFDHHRLRRHMDAQTHRLSGKDYLHQPTLEEHLGQSLQRRQDARVVNAYAASQAFEDQAVQRALRRNAGVIHERPLDRLLDLVLAVRIDELDCRSQETAQGGFAP